MNQRVIDLHIDRVVFYGGEAMPQGRLAQSLQARLHQLVSERGFDAGVEDGRSVRNLQTRARGAGAAPDALADALANAVYNTISPSTKVDA